MSEVQTRPSTSRGRGSAIRTGRGGMSSRGGGRFGARQNNGEAPILEPSVSLEEQGELGQLKKQYMSQLDTLKELFPDWTDDDLVFALQETNGDLQNTIERITEGTVSRFADVKKKTKEKKFKDSSAHSAEIQTTSTRSRGGRGGFEGGRGGRGRGAERGRGAGRGGRGGSSAAIGRAIVPSTTTTETPGWDVAPETAPVSGSWEQAESASVGDGTNEGQWASVITSDNTPATASEGQKSSLIPQGVKKSWASMLAQKTPVPVVPKPLPPSVIEPEPMLHDEAPVDQVPSTQSIEETEAVPPIPIAEEFPVAEDIVEKEDPMNDPIYQGEAEAVIELTPSKDKLTEDNVEHLPDSSIPAPTETAASTVDPGSTVGTVTPFTSSHLLSAGRPPMGGYAATAWKATGTPGRSASFQRIMEQREAVVMPSNHAVDRATVQFGSMGLNGDSNPLDIDEDREDAETRTQPPQQSPPSQPRASLPPAPHQQPSAAVEQAPQETLPTPKPAPGLPPVSQLSSTSISNQQMSQTPLDSQIQGSQQYGQYGRYGAGALSQEQSAPPQKPYDPFSQQLNYPQNHQDTQGGYSSHSQASGHVQPGQSHLGGFSQGQSDYGSQQYGTEQQRSGFQNYYSGSYGQQGSSGAQENMPPQRSTSGFGAHESSYSNNHGAPNQSRFGEAQTSGNNTPAPTAATQPQSVAQSQQGQQMHQQSQGQTGHGGYNAYGPPYYNNGSYYGNYMSQYPGYNYNQQNYGAPFGGKNSAYGQPHHAYGMSPQTSYEHSSTPGNTGGLGGSSQGRDSAFSGGLGDYGRSGSTQQSQTQQHHTNYSSFQGEQPDSFGRSPSGMNQYGGQQGEASLKPYQDQKSGASPSLAQPGRAGSAANNAGYGGNQSNFAPPQSQQGFGAYPSHLHNNHGSQYGALGGLGGGHQGNAQSHQGGGAYGNYGAGGFGSNYGNYGRGGWGGNYGH